jgi:hypothetical protein
MLLLVLAYPPPPPPNKAYIGKPLRDFNTERDGGEAATKIIVELADNGSDFELILTLILILQGRNGLLILFLNGSPLKESSSSNTVLSLNNLYGTDFL